MSQSLNWRDISKNCAISEYHFHRIFCAYMKETPRDFIIRKRLEKAIGLIAYNCDDINLSQIALECGYSTQSNFNKAFKAYFGVTPKQIIEGKDPQNSKIGKIKSKYGKDFKIENLYPNYQINKDQKTNEVNMNAQIKSFPVRKVIYRTSEQGYIDESIFKVWNELLTAFGQLGHNVESLTKFGIGHDNPQVTPQEKCRYDACVLVDSLTNLPGNVKHMDLPEGKYACFHYKGSKEKLLQFYLDIYKNWFSQNGYEPGDFPLIERYIAVDPDDKNADIELETQFFLK